MDGSVEVVSLSVWFIIFFFFLFSVRYLYLCHAFGSATSLTLPYLALLSIITIIIMSTFPSILFYVILARALMMMMMMKSLNRV